MVRFLVFSDLHADAYADAKDRLDGIIHSAKANQVDFIISLGDICQPIEKNKYIMTKLNSTNIPVHHTIGNHDTDRFSVQDMILFLGEKHSYYSFILEEYKFIVLDSCFFKTEEGYDHFPRPKTKSCIYPVIPDEQMKWLQEELSDGKKYILFSHQSLVNDFANRGIANRFEVRKLFEGHDVLLCMNGHDHGDGLKVLDHTLYYTVNASSGYCWYNETETGYETEKMPYKDPLHVIVELDDSKVTINGMESQYVNRKPDDVGVDNYMWNGVSILPRTSSYVSGEYNARID